MSSAAFGGGVNRCDVLFEKMRSYSFQPCIDSNECSATYGQVLEEVAHWQARFADRGIGAGSVIGLRADYSMTAIAALLSLFSRRAVVALIPRSGNQAAYLTDACAGALLEIGPEGDCEWPIVERSESHPLIERLRATGDGGVVIFTSGSTGRAKATLHGLERFLGKFDAGGRRFRTLAFLLFDHVAGLDTLLYTLANGGTLILTRRRDPHSILRLIESHKVEVLPASPSFLRLICAVRGEAVVASLRIITYGAEPMDQSTLVRLNERFPGVQIAQKYGATELGAPRSASRGNDSLWLKIKTQGVETKVIDGVLWIRSEATMLGYLNAPSPVDAEGWYCTGDLVDVDGEWIRFQGRVADVINVGGEKVAPAEVEEVLLELDCVREAVVSGAPHALMGQVVTARIRLTDSKEDPKEMIRKIRAHCKARLPAWKVPIAIEIVPGGLTNERQKMRRRAGPSAPSA